MCLSEFVLPLSPGSVILEEKTGKFTSVLVQLQIQVIVPNLHAAIYFLETFHSFFMQSVQDLQLHSVKEEELSVLISSFLEPES